MLSSSGVGDLVTLHRYSHILQLDCRAEARVSPQRVVSPTIIVVAIFYPFGGCSEINVLPV